MTQVGKEYDLYHIGDIVKVVGLKTEKYNGKLAQIAGPFLVDTKRWPVRIKGDTHEKLALKSTNLQRAITVMPLSYKASYSSGIYGVYKADTVSDNSADTEDKYRIYIDEDDDDDALLYATTEDFNDYVIEEGKSPQSPQSQSPQSPMKMKYMQVAQLEALRNKYSSRKVILPSKSKSRAPQCFNCSGFYHIQSDPLSAYDGVGIVCELCGKNRTDNPELLLEDHYYKCEGCENVDICCKCYRKEKNKLINIKSST